MKCRFGCPDYGRRATCPPLAPTIGEFAPVLTDYQTALLVWVEAGGGDDLHRTRRRLHEANPHPGARSLSGRCVQGLRPVDGTLSVVRGRGDVHAGCLQAPDKVRPSLSGCGVDAFATAAAAGVQMQHRPRPRRSVPPARPSPYRERPSRCGLMQDRAATGSCLAARRRARRGCHAGRWAACS